MAKKKTKSKTRGWSKTGLGATIRMDSEVIDGHLCARLATTKSKAARVSLFYDAAEKAFYSVVSLVTGFVYVEELPGVAHAQLLYNSLSRRVHPDKLEMFGIVNPLESEVSDLEDELLDQFEAAV